jgi:capsular exopolysaccharide synthesis family protein
MSRVDEARRRAAAAGAELGIVRMPPRPSGEDVGALGREVFPIEISEQRRVEQRSTHRGEPLPEAPPAAAPRPRRQTAARKLTDQLVRRLAQKVVTDQNIVASSREQYRRLAATLHHAQTSNGLKVIMIASAVQGEGKTLTAINLALTFSESYRRRVLLVDTDLRRPSLHVVFGVDNSAGLLENLTSTDERSLPVRQISPHLALLTAGQPSSDPMAGLTSHRMERLIQEAREAFDWVILDTSPVALLPDANLLASLVDGAVVVVKAHSTSYELVKRAIETIGPTRTLGVVLNCSKNSSDTYEPVDYDVEAS